MVFWMREVGEPEATETLSEYDRVSLVCSMQYELFCQIDWKVTEEPKEPQMDTVTAGGNAVPIGDVEHIQAAGRIGIDIPLYCWHPGLSVVATCRKCLIGAARRHPSTGEISFVPNLVPARRTPAKDGAVFLTDTRKLSKDRAQVKEDLLLRHPVDCPICDKSGECYLQDYHFQHGQKGRRAHIRPFSMQRRDVGPTVTHFVDRCIMCTRCIRFYREVSGTSRLLVVNRGACQEIDSVPGFPLINELAGNVVDLCPVDALPDVDFFYQHLATYQLAGAAFCRTLRGRTSTTPTGCNRFLRPFGLPQAPGSKGDSMGDCWAGPGRSIPEKC